MSQVPLQDLPAAPAEQLDPLNFPLRGSRLIEASAGTGKTYTIALLYVRLVLGHGGSQGFTRALMPPEILVVTFTDAATKELRERIRARLSEAAILFRREPGGGEPEDDELLFRLRSGYPEEQWPDCARALQLAAEWMDDAAVSTIHSWCNRMLREHAFDSGSLFTQTLETDQGELLAEVVRDYWRTFMIPLDVADAAEVRTWWAEPQDLQAMLKNLVEHAELLPTPQSPVAALAMAREEKMHRLAELKKNWVIWTDELATLLNEALAHKQVNGQKIHSRYYQLWLEKLRAWALDPVMVFPDLKSTSTAWTRLTPMGMAEAWKQGDPPAHPALAAMAGLRDALNALPDARNELLCHAARWVANRFETEQNRHAQMGFEDLLIRLDAALQGPNAERLAMTIRQQFPAALIDEFQDTDPVQYRIFDSVYRVAENDPATALILIGDPKQAIYAFRGADIFTYLAARRACAGRLYTLKTNFRSTQAMVNAANRCFAVAERRQKGQGAFLFRTAQDNPVPFVDAVAKGRREVLQIKGAAIPALTAWWLPGGETGKALGRTRYREHIADACASGLVRLLNLGQSGKAGFQGQNDFRPLQPKDIAVLVNSRREADTIRKALARRGVRSVYLSDRDSVYASPQALELEYWLAACAEPDDGRLLRAALATPTLGLSYATLDALNYDEAAWEARVLQFRRYRDCWQHQGVLPMVRALLNDFQVPTKLLGHGDPESEPMRGERVLTDLLHLAELLQQAATLLEGEHALIRFLAEQRIAVDNDVGNEARQIRLESDADLVQVVTVHKAKGLEYPLVFLPFASQFRVIDATKDLPLKWHDAKGELQVGLTADDRVLEWAEAERLGEDLRKLYVALTRARHATWVGLGPLENLEQSAIGYLLGGGEPIPPDAFPQHLEDLKGDCADMSVAPAPEITVETFREQQLAITEFKAREPRRAVRENWWIASYSALKADKGGTGHAYLSADTAAEDTYLEVQAGKDAPALAGVGDKPSPAFQSVAESVSLHDFPAGAEAGTFLHDLLEWSANLGFAETLTQPALLRDQVARRCQIRGWAHWVEPLTEWLRHFLALPLETGRSAAPVALASLKTYRAEMEFWLAANTVTTGEIDRLVRRHALVGEPRPDLQPLELNGMLKGFIDLVFEHEGVYYVADYKSNKLGTEDAAYTRQAIRGAILHSRYDLQYVLYLLALHRHLRSRLPEYNYDRHIGGALYFFLRGTGAPTQGLHAERPPRALIETLDRLFAGASLGAFA
ncbi:MAG: exodeoxyribonuclease V subunit beta [Methylococcaceae bacterium]|nr:exodeoxyribonuclease V subunit beta [Methylococcaceae bacterium]